MKFTRTGHAETDDVLARGEKVLADLEALRLALVAMGADWRALDIKEAMASVTGALGYDE